MSDLHAAIERLIDGVGGYVSIHALRAVLKANPREQICGNVAEAPQGGLLCRLPLGHDGAHRSVDGSLWVETS